MPHMSVEISRRDLLRFDLPVIQVEPPSQPKLEKRMVPAINPLAALIIGSGLGAAAAGYGRTRRHMLAVIGGGVVGGFLVVLGSLAVWEERVVEVSPPRP